MKVLITVCAASMMAACASPGVSTAKNLAVKPATAEQVAGCVYLDDVMGASTWYGWFASQGHENARAEALHKAAGLGATHLVWGPPDTKFGGTSVSGKAYRCAS